MSRKRSAEAAFASRSGGPSAASVFPATSAAALPTTPAASGSGADASSTSRPNDLASSTIAADPASEWNPPSQSTADGSPVVPGTGRKPISPVPPEAPRRSAPSRTTAAPVP